MYTRWRGGGEAAAAEAGAGAEGAGEAGAGGRAEGGARAAPICSVVPLRPFASERISLLF